MKNIFIITLGTREVQLRKTNLSDFGFVVSVDENRITHPDLPEMQLNVYKNQMFADFLCLAEPRISGEIILENWDYLKKVIEFPLIDQAWNTILSGETIDDLILVYTDQKGNGSESITHINNDTVSFRNIFRRQLDERDPGFPNHPERDIAITEQIADIDFQYRNFAVTCKALYEQETEIQQVFLLAQGGIDQINHALTLQLIQAFGSKVKLWQQAEGKGPSSLEFPFLFIQDLNKQKVIKHLEDYDFGFINKTLTTDKVILHLAQYANARLNLRHNTVQCNLDYLDKHMSGQLIERMKREIFNCQDLTRIKDLYISAKINFRHENYGDFVWRLFTIAEKLFAVKIEDTLPNPHQYYRGDIQSGVSNGLWEKKLKEISAELPTYLNSKNIHIHNPNRKSFYEIFLFLENQKGNNDLEIFKRVFGILEDLARKRNDLAHNLKPIKKEHLATFFGKKYDLTMFLDDMDRILQVDGYEIFESIQSEMIKIIDSAC